MSPAVRALLVALVFGLLVAGCSQPEDAPGPGRSGAAGGDVLQGSFRCGPDAATLQDTLEFTAGGKVTINQPGRDPAEASYSLDGARGDIEGDPFSVEGDRLLFDDGFVCQKQS